MARQIGRRDSKAKVTITVEDKNDQSPKFIKDVYEQTIEENLDPGVFVAQVRIQPMFKLAPKTLGS